MKIFASDFWEDDEAIQAYCKEDEQKDAEKIPPKACFVFFPYSIAHMQNKVKHLFEIFTWEIFPALFYNGIEVRFS